jgi:hypothetical protein
LKEKETIILELTKYELAIILDLLNNEKIDVGLTNGEERLLEKIKAFNK